MPSYRAQTSGAGPTLRYASGVATTDLYKADADDVLRGSIVMQVRAGKEVTILSYEKRAACVGICF
jgi:hypothetical protein